MTDSVTSLSASTTPPGRPGAGSPGAAAGPSGPDRLRDVQRQLEAVLLVADEPLDEQRLAAVLQVPQELVMRALAAAGEELRRRGSGVDLRRSGAGWRYYTATECAPTVERFLLEGQSAKLSQAALETLTIIAYRQPVSRGRVSAIRGVNVDAVVRTLLTRGLVTEFGTDTETGAVLYGTTTLFLEKLGMQTLDELPSLAPLMPEIDELDNA